LIEQLKSRYNIDIERLSVTDKAKQMEKERIINSYVDGQSSVMNFGVYQQAEKYYNETYGKE
jgi:hypothetical protein